MIRKGGPRLSERHDLGFGPRDQGQTKRWSDDDSNTSHPAPARNHAALRLGTFLPFLRAFDKPIAMACLRLSTLPPLPPRPLRAVPRLWRCISLFTSLPELREYLRFRFAITFSKIVLCWRAAFLICRSVTPLHIAKTSNLCGGSVAGNRGRAQRTCSRAQFEIGETRRWELHALCMRLKAARGACIWKSCATTQSPA